jgi:hypothetical protein
VATVQHADAGRGQRRRYPVLLRGLEEEVGCRHAVVVVAGRDGLDVTHANLPGLERPERTDVERAAGARTQHGQVHRLSADVLYGRVFAEDEVREMRRDARGQVAGNVEPDRIAALQDLHVGDHASLRRQQRGVAARAGRQGSDVVGEQPLQVRQAVAPGQPNQPPRAPIENGRAFHCRRVAFR